MHTPMYHLPIHTGHTQAGVVAQRPVNGHFNPYLPAMDYSGYGGYGWTRGAGLFTNLGDTWTNWRVKRTEKQANKWVGRADKQATKQVERGLPPTGSGAYGPAYAPGMVNGAGAGGYPPGGTQMSAMGGGLTPGMAIGGVVIFAGMVAIAMYATKD